MARGQRDRWHRDSTVLQTRDAGSTCSVTRCCPTAQTFPFEPQGSVYPSLAWLFCSAQCHFSFPSFPSSKPCSISQTVSPNPPPVEEAARGGLARVTGTLVSSGGASGHLPALLPLDKPCSLPRTGLGGTIPPSKRGHGVQPCLFPSGILPATEGEFQSYIPSFIDASSIVSYPS